MTPSLVQRYPDIPWLEPIWITIASRESGFGCRICIAENGFRARDGHLFASKKSHTEHVAAAHPEYVRSEE